MKDNEKKKIHTPRAQETKLQRTLPLSQSAPHISEATLTSHFLYIALSLSHRMNPKLKYLAAERASLLCQPLSSIEIGGMTTTTTDSDRESFLSKTSVHDQAVLLLSIADIAQSELQSRGTIQLWEEDEDFPKFPILSSSNCVGTAGVGDDAINDRAVTVNKPPSLVPRIHARLNSNNVSSSSSPSSSFPRWADSTAPRTVWATAVATAAAAKTGPNRIRSVSLDLQSHVLLRDCSIDMDEVEDDEDNQCNHLLFQGDVDSQRRTPLHSRRLPPRKESFLQEPQVRLSLLFDLQPSPLHPYARHELCGVRIGLWDHNPVLKPWTSLWKMTTIPTD